MPRLLWHLRIIIEEPSLLLRQIKLVFFQTHDTSPLALAWTPVQILAEWLSLE